MSLQYVIDAYNLINHPAFKPAAKSAVSIQQALADFIQSNKLTGSKNNRIVLVFDGFAPRQEDIPWAAGLCCMFSRNLEADELIKRIIEESSSPRNIVVVSDDKEVQLISRFLHAQVCGVENFICAKKRADLVIRGEVYEDAPKLSYAKIQKINAELKKKWLE